MFAELHFRTVGEEKVRMEGELDNKELSMGEKKRGQQQEEEEQQVEQHAPVC